MSYLEKQKGIQSGDEYSPTFLELDAKSGPWLVKVQQEAVTSKYPNWDLNADDGVLTFGDDERTGVVASIQIIGTYTADDSNWLWGWSNPEMGQEAARTAQVRDEHEDIPELTNPTYKCTEIKAWSVAAAAAYAMKAESCYRLPGDDVSLFVALFDITELKADDPRAAHKTPEPAAAAEALADFVGPAALNVGGLLLDALRTDEVPMDEVIAAIHAISDNLGELSKSPVGKGTPAATEAELLAGVLRQGALALSVPPGHPALEDGARQMLAVLQDIAKRYGAWPED